MGKSDLKSFLEAAGSDRVALTFRQVEILLGERLPDAALRMSWWGELPDENRLASEWTDAGYQPDTVDVSEGNIVFRKSDRPRRLIPGTEVPGGDPTLFYTRDCRHPAFGALRGMLKVEPGYDLTQPLIDPDWLDEKYGA